MAEWLFVIRVETAVVFIICLIGNLRAAQWVGRTARQKNRPISKSIMIGLNMLLAMSLLAMVISLRGRPPVDIENAVLSVFRNGFLGALALKTIIAEELVIRRPERLFRPSEQQRIADLFGVPRGTVDGILREFMK